MSIVLDLVLIAVVITLCVAGYNRGLIISLLNLLFTIGAMVLAILFYPLLAMLLVQLSIEWMTPPVVYFLSVIILFILIRVAFMFLKKFINAVTTRVPVLHQLNSIGGLAFGLLESVFMLSIAGILFRFFGDVLGDDITSIVQGSFIGNFFYENNPLIMLITRGL